MLLDHVVDFCDKEFKKADTDHVCENCNHPLMCHKNTCRNCLDEVHFPTDHPGGKVEYDCTNMLNYYVCSYSHKYCSEIEYALNEVQDLKNFKEFNVMSIGCGACPDLMALESFNNNNNLKKPIVYCGYDKNELWKSTHKEIKNYCNENSIKMRVKYVDVIEFFKEYYVNGINLLFLQYVISYFYNTDQIKIIDTFFDDLVDSIVTKRNKGENFIIIINDVNSCYRGRDYFRLLVKKLMEYDLHGSLTKKYFDYQIKSNFQRYGDPYHSFKNLHLISDSIREQYNPAIYCSSAQLIIEVK